MKAENKSCCVTTQSEGDDRATYVPPADILESKERFTLLLDVPGVEERDVSIDVDKNVLTVSAAVKATSPGAGHELRYAEYGEGNYRRRFRLANGFDLGRVEASLKDGLLTITLPKASEVLPKKIQVRAA